MRRLVTLGLVSLAFACKQQPATDLKVYEEAQYQGQNVCELMKTEAKTKAGAGNAFDAYKEIFDRERKIFALLVPKAKACAEAPVKDAKADGQIAAADATTPPVEDDLKVTVEAELAIPPSEDAACAGLVDAGRLQDLEKKESDLQACDPFNEAQVEALRTALAGEGGAGGASGPSETSGPGAPTGAEGQSGAPTDETQPQEAGLALAGGGAKRSSVCEWLGIEASICAKGVEKGFKLSEKGIEKLCGAAGDVIKSQPLGKYDTKAAAECSAAIIEDICGRYGALVVSGAKAADDAAKAMEEKTKQFGMEAIDALATQFADSTIKCLQAYGEDQIKAYALANTKELMKSAFGRSIMNAESFLQDKRKAAIVAAACGTVSVVGGAAFGKYDNTKSNNESCKGITAMDRQRASACVQTAKDGCDAVGGKIDLAGSFDISDQNVAGKVFADVSSTVLEGACGAGGKVSGAACSVIGKASGYIKDSFQGKSNPWADCLGTPQMGECLYDKWAEFSTGIKKEDYAVGNEVSKQNPVSKKFENRICWCWRRCMSSDWGTDREVFKGYWYYRAEKGDAGVRFCAAQGRKVVWPDGGGLTWENGSRNVYIKYDGCEISAARGDAESLQDDLRQLEIFYNNKWQTFQMSKPGECGGRTDQGI